ncbi:MAG: hypothetical protein ACK2UY_04440, partial [Anaerolineae bacterium]
DLVVLVVRDQSAGYLRTVVAEPLARPVVEQALARVIDEAEGHGMVTSAEQVAEAMAGLGARTTSTRTLNTLEILTLRSRNRVSGLLALGSRRENAIGEDLMETLKLFAHESAIVLDNSLLYRQLGRANRELQRTIDELRASQAREAALRQEVRALKIEIDEAKRQKQVAEITETDYFQQLREKARRLRDKE